MNENTLSCGSYDFRLTWFGVLAQVCLHVGIYLVFFRDQPIWAAAIRLLVTLWILWFGGQLHYQLQGGGKISKGMG